MQKAAHSSFRPQRLLTLLAAFSLSAGATAADRPAFNSLWAELRSSAHVTCPKDVALPRPLVAAAACGDLTRVRDRVRAGADLSATDPRPALAGRTALHHAAQRGDAAMLSLLLDAGADPNATDGQGNTPLHLLAASPPTRDSVEMARQLLAFGADARLKNNLGRTAAATLETAAARRISPLHMDRKALLELLLQAQATGPVRTAEPSLVVAAPETAQDASAEPPAVDAAQTTEAAPAPEAAAEPDLQAEAKTAPTSDATGEARPEPTPEPVAEAKPAPTPEPKPEPKPEAKPEPTPAPQAEPKSEPAAAPKAESKPQPTAEPKAESRPAQADPDQVGEALRAWAADWSSGDVEAYLRHYSRHFVPSDGNTLKTWQEQRRARVTQPASIRVTLSDVAIEVDGKRAVARFVQDYQSDDYKVVNRKVVEFAHEGGSWKIVSERNES